MHHDNKLSIILNEFEMHYQNFFRQFILIVAWVTSDVKNYHYSKSMKSLRKFLPVLTPKPEFLNLNSIILHCFETLKCRIGICKNQTVNPKIKFEMSNFHKVK